MLVDSENEITNPEPVDLAEVAGHVVALARANATETHIAIEEKWERAGVLGDPVMLEQLARNLVENAIRHNRPGGWIRVETAAADGKGILRVSNSGDLIPDYEVPHLFEPFRRLKTGGSGGERGFGLGLSIVRAIVGAHSGQIETFALPEGGLSVTVLLPAMP
jgi:signal transduction histidine kinase